MNNKVWIYKNIDNSIIREMMIKYGFSRICSAVLHNRIDVIGGKVDNLFKRVLHNLHNPFLLNDMDLAVIRIEKAIIKKEKITVYGDYDADGVTSTSILYDFLISNGANADYYIPNRFSDGYGMNNDAIDEIYNKGTNLIITVDNGISAYKEIEYAKSLGIDVIVTDHHECSDILPECCAVINPKRKDNNYPFSELAGVGVVFKLISALNKDCIEKIIKKYILITAIGTVADVVPLNDENRAIVLMGLKMMTCNNNPGVKALADICGIENQAKISDFSFSIIPRINAAGRLSNADECVRLFTSNNYSECCEIAKKLDNLNTQRQEIEKNILEEAFETIEKNKLHKDNVIVVYGEEWNSGIIGIVASKVSEKFYKPCLILTNDTETIAKGSGRSINGFDLFDALNSCSDLLLKFGGHYLAAGLSLDINNIDLFRKKINEYADNLLHGESFIQTINIDYTLESIDINIDSFKSVDILEPFGVGNPKPVFAVLNAEVVKKQLLSDGKHIKLTLNCDGIYIDAIGFSMGDFYPLIIDNCRIDIAGNIDINSYKGKEYPQIIIKDIKRIKQK